MPFYQAKEQAMIKNKQSKFHTDAFTRGGQIFSHEWRMRFQNYKVVSLWANGFGLLGLWVSFLYADLSIWLLWDFYAMSYLSGKIKVFLWPQVQDFLINLTLI